MEIRKAVITAAARGLRLYPCADTVQKGMLPIVDRDGLTKPVIQIIAEEALENGIEQICIVCAPGDETRYIEQLRLLRENLLEAHKGISWARVQADRLDMLVSSLRFAVQYEPLGYGHAVCCAREFVGGEPFLLLLSDHLYLSHSPDQRCASQLISLAVAEGCPVSAVQATREHLVGRFGTLSGKRLPDNPGVYQIERIMEKPALSQAELYLQTPGLRAGHYLCFFGMHILPPEIFRILEDALPAASSEEPLQLTPALQVLSERQKYLAVEVAGRRYDIGAQLGLFQSQAAIGLAGKDREEILALLLEVLSESHLLPSSHS